VRGILVGALVLAACGPEARDGWARETFDVPVGGPAPLDVLFVVDNSLPMAPRQAELAADIGRFFAALNAEGPQPDLRVGVVTSDLGTLDVPTDQFCATSDEGALRSSGCLSGGEFLVDGAEGVNHAGSVAEATACMIQVGEGGCGFEQHLEAMQLALTTSAFVRPEASLAVVILSDEDDCSVHDPQFYLDFLAAMPGSAELACFTAGVRCEPDDPGTVGEKTGCRSRADSAYVHPVQRYADLLASLKPDPTRLTVGVIAGPAEPVVVVQANPDVPRLSLLSPCDQTAGRPMPAIRLTELATAFPERNVVMSACAATFPGLSELGALARRSVSAPFCLGRPVTTDCDVVLVEPGHADVAIAACTATGGRPPCWRIVEDPVACVASAHQVMELVSAEPPPRYARLRATCTIDDV
jgi:hypothetical protein